MSFVAKPIPLPATKEAKDVETGITNALTNPLQGDIDRLQELCNAKVQAFLDPHLIYSHLIIYLQQFTAGNGLSLTTQQISVLKHLVQEAGNKGFISNKAALMSRLS